LSKCKATKDIEFNKFYEYLIKYFTLQKKPEESHYLKEALRLTFFIKSSDPDPSKMTSDNFGVLGRLYKFTKKKDDTFIQRIVEVFKADWFYGYVDRAEVQNQLEALTKRKSDNCTYFIVRFANSRQFCYTYKKDGNNWENSNIEPDKALKEGYAKYVSHYQKLKILKHETVVSLQKSFTPYSTKK